MNTVEITNRHRLALRKAIKLLVKEADRHGRSVGELKRNHHNHLAGEEVFQQMECNEAAQTLRELIGAAADAVKPNKGER